ncbi:DMT family transporter [Myxococcota bacterium]|nr:DMT family transporter [Myxococcota bacterium]MBU1498881.1 DMT family transporter [Myxococcota bacterium]
MNFIYKVAAEQKLVNSAVILTAAGTVVLCSSITLVITGTGFRALMPAVPFALSNGTLFAMAALSKFAALKLAPASVVFPVNKSNVLFVIIIGLVFFSESPTNYQWLGIVFSLAVLLLISSEQIKLSGSNILSGVGLALVAALCTSLSMTAGKLASTRVDKNSYILLSYSIVVVVSLVAFLRKTQGEKKSAFKGYGVFLTGGFIGLLNYFGYKLVLSAFAAGSMSLVQPILAMSILIPISLSIIIYREKLTIIRIIAIGLTLASILLIKSH